LITVARRTVPYSRDTTPDADAVQLALYRKMSASDRVRIGYQMSLDARAITLAAIRRRHPEYDDASARWALFRILVGDELFQKAWPNAPLVDPRATPPHPRFATSRRCSKAPRSRT